MDFDAEMERLRKGECPECGILMAGEHDQRCSLASWRLRAEVERYKDAAFEAELRASRLDAERDIAKAFYDLVVKQRNAAWAEVQRLLEDNVRWVDASDALGTELASERERVKRLRAWGFALEARPVESAYRDKARAGLQPDDLGETECVAALRGLVDALREHLPNARVSVDASDFPDMVTYADVEIGSRAFTIAVRGDKAFGVADKDKPGFGSSPDWVFKNIAELIEFLREEVWKEAVLKAGPPTMDDLVKGKDMRHGPRGTDDE